ncbi:MAG: hypothetical protein KC444_09270 [Nitrosopumilus sp.]|nr:hypothetical protein [Nitrosopumilus sp.]
MTSTGVRKPSSQDTRIIRGLIENEKAFVESLKPFSSESSLGGLGGSGGSTPNTNSPAGNYLPTAGGSMIGSIAFYPILVELVNDTLDITKIAENDSTRIIVDAEGVFATTDDLIKINGENLPGQLLNIQGIVTQTITIKHLATGGNIRTFDGSDVVLSGNQNLWFVFDSVANQWAQVGGAGGGGGSASTVYAVDNQGNQSGTVVHSLSAATRHELKFTAIGNCTLSFTNYPSSGTGIDWLVSWKQDGVGGHSVTFPSEVEWPNGVTPVFSTAPGSDNIVSLHCDDGGTVVKGIFLSTVTTSGGGVVPGSAENDHLQWDSGAWVPRQTFEFNSVGPWGDSGYLRFPNNEIMISARNLANTGNLEIKFDASDFLDITRSDNQPVTLKIRSQHATNPDQIATMTQYSGTSAVTDMRVPTKMELYATSANVMNYDQNKIELNKNILPIAGDGVLNIGGSTEPNRFLAMYATTFGMDANRNLNFNIGGGALNVNGVGDSFVLSVDSITKLTSTATLTTLAGNANVTGNMEIGSKIIVDEISAPVTNPDVNTGWIYGKDVGGHTEPFWEDELGNVTNLLSGGGSPTNVISQGDSSVVVSDTGSGNVSVTIDGIQKIGVSGSTISLADDVDLGFLSTDIITVNGKIGSDVLPVDDGIQNLGGSSNYWNGIYSENYKIKGSGGDTTASIRNIYATASEMIFNVPSGDGYKFKSNNVEILGISSTGNLDPIGDLNFDAGKTVNFNSGQSTVGAEGLANAIPGTTSNPSIWIIVKLGGTEYVIPAFAKT